jgi:hypothetical protein
LENAVLICAHVDNEICTWLRACGALRSGRIQRGSHVEVIIAESAFPNDKHATVVGCGHPQQRFWPLASGSVSRDLETMNINKVTAAILPLGFAGLPLTNADPSCSPRRAAVACTKAARPTYFDPASGG